jgi:hypothetical protein
MGGGGYSLHIDAFWIGWFDLLTPYSHNSGLQAVQHYRWSTVHRCTHTRVLSVQWSCPGKGFITVSLSVQITCEVFLSQRNIFLAMILQLPVPKTQHSLIPQLASSYPGRLASLNSPLSTATSQLKTSLQPFCTDHAENSFSIGKACLLRSCIETEFARLLVAYLLPRECLPIRYLTMNVYSDFTISAFGHLVKIFCRPRASSWAALL